MCLLETWEPSWKLSDVVIAVDCRPQPTSSASSHISMYTRYDAHTQSALMLVPCLCSLVSSALAHTLQQHAFSSVSRFCMHACLAHISPSFQLQLIPTSQILNACYELQGPATSKYELKVLSTSIKHNTAITVSLVSYARGGCKFLNNLRATPLFGAGGRVTHLLGVLTGRPREKPSTLDCSVFPSGNPDLGH
jgi:hypothetical protein